MSALPAGFTMDDTNSTNSVDSNYLQFVVGFLDDADNYSDFVGRERADSITECKFIVSIFQFFSKVM